jgi:hypothetical protein
VSLAGRPSTRDNGDPFTNGPARVPHSCGHVVDWRGKGGSLAWRGFVAGMAEYPCPWCGGETAAERVPANVAYASFGDVPGLRDVRAEKVTS